MARRKDLEIIHSTYDEAHPSNPTQTKSRSRPRTKTSKPSKNFFSAFLSRNSSPFPTSTRNPEVLKPLISKTTPQPQLEHKLPTGYPSSSEFQKSKPYNPSRRKPTHQEDLQINSEKILSYNPHLPLEPTTTAPAPEEKIFLGINLSHPSLHQTKRSTTTLLWNEPSLTLQKQELHSPSRKRSPVYLSSRPLLKPPLSPYPPKQKQKQKSKLSNKFFPYKSTSKSQSKPKPNHEPLLPLGGSRKKSLLPKIDFRAAISEGKIERVVPPPHSNWNPKREREGITPESWGIRDIEGGNGNGNGNERETRIGMEENGLISFTDPWLGSSGEDWGKEVVGVVFPNDAGGEIERPKTRGKKWPPVVGVMDDDDRESGYEKQGSIVPLPPLYQTTSASASSSFSLSKDWKTGNYLNTVQVQKEEEKEKERNISTASKKQNSSFQHQVYKLNGLIGSTADLLDSKRREVMKSTTTQYRYKSKEMTTKAGKSKSKERDRDSIESFFCIGEPQGVEFEKGGKKVCRVCGKVGVNWRGLCGFCEVEYGGRSAAPILLVKDERVLEKEKEEEEEGEGTDGSGWTDEKVESPRLGKDGVIGEGNLTMGDFARWSDAFANDIWKEYDDLLDDIGGEEVIPFARSEDLEDGKSGKALGKRRRGSNYNGVRGGEKSYSVVDALRGVYK